MKTVTLLKRTRSFGNVTITDDGTGLFHGWGVDYEDSDSGPGNYTCAIVEMPDGSVRLPRADMIRFDAEIAPLPYLDLIKRGYRALDSTKHCEDKMTAPQVLNDRCMRNTVPAQWTLWQVETAEAAARKANTPTP